MKYEIEIPDLPEGWEPVAYREPEVGECFLAYGGKVMTAARESAPWLILRRKEVWRPAELTDLPVNGREPKMARGVDKFGKTVEGTLDGYQMGDGKEIWLINQFPRHCSWCQSATVLESPPC